VTKALPVFLGGALLALAVAAHGASTDAPEPASATPANAADTPVENADAEADAKVPAPPPTPEQRRYLDAVQALEAHGGAYDAALSEQLLGLGSAYQAAGRHAEAAEALARAAHITRVNEGLYSTSDLPILERLIESYSALGEWDGVGTSYQQMFQIHRRNYGESDERMLPALQRLSAWHLGAYLGDIGEDPINHLEAARNLYESSLGILQAKPPGSDPRLPEALREKAIVDYYLASYVPTGSGGVSFSAGPSNAQQQAGPAYAITGFTAGRAALERVVELRRQDTASSPLLRGQAAAELGDWHQLFNRRQTALELYKEAWTQAAADTSNAAVNQIFGHPIALPVLPEGLAALAEAGLGTSEAQGNITVTFAVNERGLVEDIRIVEPQAPAPPAAKTPEPVADPADAAAPSESGATATPAAAPPETPEQKSAALQADKLRKRLRATRFRPRFESGIPVPTPDITYTYRYSL
jgi:tetratricopeptide (TPR) repeat protein